MDDSKKQTSKCRLKGCSVSTYSNKQRKTLYHDLFDVIDGTDRYFLGLLNLFI